MSALGTAIGDPLYSGGKKRMLQLEHWKRYLDWNMAAGYKIVLTAVHDATEPIQERQTYQKEIRFLLLKLIYDKDEETVKFTQDNLWRKLYFVNAKYNDFWEENKFLEEHENATERDIIRFKRNTYSKCNSALKSAMRYFENRHNILVEVCEDIVDLNGNIHKASDKEIQIVLKCKKETDKEFGIDLMTNPESYIFLHHKKYYKSLNAKLRGYGIKREAKVYYIHLLSKEEIKKELNTAYAELTDKQIGLALNAKIAEGLERTISTQYDNHLKKITEQQAVKLLGNRTMTRPEEWTDEYQFNELDFHGNNKNETLEVHRQLIGEMIKTE